MQNWHSVPSWLSCTLLGARSTDPMSVRMQTADRSIRYLVVLPDQPLPTSDTTALMQPPSTEHSDAYSCSTWPRRARPYSRPYAQCTLPASPRSIGCGESSCAQEAPKLPQAPFLNPSPHWRDHLVFHRPTELTVPDQPSWLPTPWQRSCYHDACELGFSLIPEAEHPVVSSNGRAFHLAGRGSRSIDCVTRRVEVSKQFCSPRADFVPSLFDRHVKV